MILDIEIPIAFVPILLLIGIALVVYGREILDVLSFVVGAVAAGLLVFMIFEGLLHNIEIPFVVEVLTYLIVIFVGGLVGKGTLAMLLAMFVSTVIVDVLIPFVGEDNLLVLSVIGVLLFLGLVAIVQRFMTVFSSFLGGVMVAMSVTSFLDGMDDGTMRIIQLAIASVLCLAGSFIQHYLYKQIAKRSEEISWVPTPSGG